MHQPTACDPHRAAGHSCEHELETARINGALGNVDANTGDAQVRPRGAPISLAEAQAVCRAAVVLPSAGIVHARLTRPFSARTLQVGWDTDQFLTDVTQATLVMLPVIRNGGLGQGGFNFDAKLRRVCWVFRVCVCVRA